MKSKEDFIRRWRNHVAGLALYGTCVEEVQPPLARATRAMQIPAETERLLAAMYDDLMKEHTHVTNGQPSKEKV